jgi:hypothetical protein
MGPDFGAHKKCFRIEQVVASVTPLHFAESLDRNGVVMMNAFREARAGPLKRLSAIDVTTSIAAARTRSI